MLVRVKRWCSRAPRGTFPKLWLVPLLANSLSAHSPVCAGRTEPITTRANIATTFLMLCLSSRHGLGRLVRQAHRRDSIVGPCHGEGGLVPAELRPGPFRQLISS